MFEVCCLFVCIIKELEAYHQHRANRRNPIFLCGPSRSGKTTILRVIEDYLSRIKDVRVCRLDAEDMVIELVKSIRNSGDTKGFYNKFYDHDALLVDNIWVLQGKPRTIEEIFILFKTLIDKGKLLVITWDIEPETLLQESKTIKELHHRSITFKMKPYNPSSRLGDVIRTSSKNYPKIFEIPPHPSPLPSGGRGGGENV